MIVLRSKKLSDIWEWVAPFNTIGIVGCGSCAAVSFAGGERQVEELKSALSLISDRESSQPERKFYGEVIKRLCELNFVEELREKFKAMQIIISLGCGAGTQVLAEVLPAKRVYPGVDTLFLGASLKNWGEFKEICYCCGDCIIGKFGGICPLTRCAKGLLNGPCGGSRGEFCEISDELCAWQLIYHRLKDINNLSTLEEIIPPKNNLTLLKPRSYNINPSIAALEK